MKRSVKRRYWYKSTETAPGMNPPECGQHQLSILDVHQEEQQLATAVHEKDGPQQEESEAGRLSGRSADS